MNLHEQPSREYLDAIDAVRADAGIPGMSFAVSRHGVRSGAALGVADAGSRESLTAESRFEVSCLMKFFVSLIAQKLVGRGVLDLSESVGHYLPDLVGCGAGELISVGNLLSHTSGYRGLDVTDAKIKWGHSWQQLVEQLRTDELLFPPGKVFNYEHSEHVLAGEVLHRVTGCAVDELLEKELFGPLGITVHTAKADRSDGVYVAQHVPAKGSRSFVPVSYPAFSHFWRSSLPDMTIRLPDLLTIGEWILARENLQICVALGDQVIELPRQVIGDDRAEVIPKSFGHVCGEYGGGLLGHNGSVLGQTVALRMDARERAVFVVGLNAWAPYVRDKAIDMISGATRILPSAATRSIRPVSFTDLAGEFRADELAGTYDGGYARQVVVEDKDGERVELRVGVDGPRQRRITLRCRGSGLWEFDPPQGLSCAFTPHPDDSSPVLHLGVHAYRKRRR